MYLVPICLQADSQHALESRISRNSEHHAGRDDPLPSAVLWMKVSDGKNVVREVDNLP